MWTRKLKRTLALAVSTALLFSGVLVSTAQAGMIATDDVIQAQQQQVDREQLKSLLDNEQVAEKLQAMGADQAEIKERIDAMTPAELAQVNENIERMPAGSDVLGVLLVIFIVFVITDALGATDIFPFVHPVQR